MYVCVYVIFVIPLSIEWWRQKNGDGNNVFEINVQAKKKQFWEKNKNLPYSNGFDRSAQSS